MSHTLLAPASFEESIQKSRFLARAWPVEAVEDAQLHINDCARELASHHCWAWRLGQQYRFHDADEPAGTAGRPILQAIDGQGYDRVVVVVTRWFGGIKLGAGGLVRAYGGCAAECLRRAERKPLIVQADLQVFVPFACDSALRQLLSGLHGALSAEHYDAEGLHAEIRLPAVHASEFELRLRDLSRGSARVTART